MKMGLGLRQQLVLGAAGTVLALVLQVRFLLMPGVARLRESRGALQELQAAIASTGALVSRLPKEQAALQDVQGRSRALASRVGERQSVARILETLSRQAKAGQLELVTMQPRAGEGGKRLLSFGPELTLSEAPLTLQVTGRYQALGEFLGRLSDAPFLSSVRTLTVTKPDAARPELRADLVLVVYLRTIQ